MARTGTILLLALAALVVATVAQPVALPSPEPMLTRHMHIHNYTHNETGVFEHDEDWTEVIDDLNDNGKIDEGEPVIEIIEGHLHNHTHTAKGDVDVTCEQVDGVGPRDKCRTHRSGPAKAAGPKPAKAAGPKPGRKLQ